MNVANHPDVSDLLRNTAMLAQLHTSFWTPFRTDRSLSADVAGAHEADAGAFAVRKNLFAGADTHFKTIQKEQSAFRSWFYQRTLPFTPSGNTRDYGPRLLANADFFTLTERLAVARRNLADSIAQLEEHYLSLVRQSERKLGSAFNPDDYPDVDRISNLYSLTVDFQPVPARGGFKGLPDDALAQLDSYIERKVGERADRASEAVQERLGAYLKRLIERMSAAHAVATDAQAESKRHGLRRSLFEEAGEISGLVQSFANIMPELAENEALTSLLARVAAMNAKDVAKDAEEIESVLDEAQDVYACFDMGE